MILSNGIKVGQKILVNGTWIKVEEVTKDGIKTKLGFMVYGSNVQGWKLK